MLAGPAVGADASAAASTYRVRDRSSQRLPRALTVAFPGRTDRTWVPVGESESGCTQSNAVTRTVDEERVG